MFGGFGKLPGNRTPGQNLGPVQASVGPVQGGNPPQGASLSNLGTVNTQPIPFPYTSQNSPQLGAVTPAVTPGFARHIFASPMKSGRPPLVNYAPGKLKLSILIPTLSSRAGMLGPLLQKLERQIKSLGPVPEVEVLIFEDNKEHSVGAKRNRLLGEAAGDFVVFVDDDDELSDDYVFQIYTAILDHPNIDCLGMRGIITSNGVNPRQVVYSLHNEGLYESEGIYFRPPCHLTPIRRQIAQKYRYPDKNFGEDSEWALAMLKDKALRSEFFIDKVLYHYRYNQQTSETAQGRPIATLPAHNTFSIVILSHLADNLRNCLTAIFQQEPMLPRSRVIVVDDGAKAGCEKDFPGITWVKGQKPFVFARNANIGIRAAGGDALLLNDDAKLISRFGFTSLSFAARSRLEVGICSAAVSGFVGNPNQTPWLVAAGMRYEPHNLAFVAVYIPKTTFERVGPLDERFVGYGFEDNDYCLRCKKAGLAMAIYDGCVVEHGIAGNSTFRVRHDINTLMDMNRAIYRAKWGAQGGV